MLKVFIYATTTNVKQAEAQKRAAIAALQRRMNRQDIVCINERKEAQGVFAVEMRNGKRRLCKVAV